MIRPYMRLLLSRFFTCRPQDPAGQVKMANFIFLGAANVRHRRGDGKA